MMKNLIKDFPIFKQKVNCHPLIYFDNAATSQKPQQVIDSISNFYSNHNANIDRGIYYFAEYATSLFEGIRPKVANFIGADPNEIVFTTGTTGGINFVALSWAEKFINSGDEIIVSQIEHHSNLIPWQQLTIRKNAQLKVIPLTSKGELDLDVFEKLLTDKTKLVAITHISNVLGTQVDINLITKKAHAVGAKVLIDAAQSVAHKKINVKEVGCDFLAFSGHKLLGPTGIGILYIKKDLHEIIDPFQFGGGMIFQVSYEKSSWLKAPKKFEAGTPPIADAIGLGAAIDYIEKNINFENLKQHEASLCSRVIDEFRDYEKIKILGPVDYIRNNGHIVSFVIDGIHAHDVAAHLDSFGICVRAGHHCAQPLHQSLGIKSSVRVSFYLYNTLDEVEYFLSKIKKLL